MSAEESGPTLAEQILEVGKTAFDPSSQDQAAQSRAVTDYDELITRSSTVALIPALNALIKPNVSPPWLREHLLRTLTRLPLRRYGVRATMEFVFSVHPSNVGRAPDEGGPQKQGANITHEAVAVATKLLSSVPAGMSAEDWFEGIAEQLFRLMDGEAGPDVAKTAAQVVGFGILGKRQYGAPGAPGWNAFVKPLIADVNPSLMTLPAADQLKEQADEDGVIDLSLSRLRVSDTSVQRSLQRLKILVLSNPAPGLCRRLLTPILQQLWTLASWIDPSSAQSEGVCKPSMLLFHTFLKLFGTRDTIMPVIHGLASQGSLKDAATAWMFRTNSREKIEAVAVTDPEQLQALGWPAIEAKASTLVDSLVTMCSPEEISSVFLRLLENWIQNQGLGKEIKVEDVTTKRADISDPMNDLIEITVLQKLMEKAPEKLISRFDQLLELVSRVLETDERSQLGDEIMTVVLSLLNLIIGAPTFRKSDMGSDKLASVEAALSRLSQQDRSSVTPTARNLRMLLRYRGELDEIEDGEAPRTKVDARIMDDRRTYALAMEYITGADSPPPVVSEGLALLITLVERGSSVLDVTSVLVLTSNLLANNEDFINLRVIKMFTVLANKHPKATVEEITEHYLDVHEKNSTDIRLRYGEALVQVIERLGQTFAGEAAERTGEILLSIAGRRGYRPKTLAKQVRQERLDKLKKGKAKVEDMALDDIAEEDEEMDEAEKANNDILAQIVSGWESRRGSEDVRMRSSALAVFSAALETNISGVGATLASAAMDLCINVLTLEPEPEKAILRRSAVIAVMSFVRALNAAREARRPLGFGLTEESRRDMVTSLEYIAATDNDGLVREQARDVAESLENWATSTMVPMEAGMEQPAGLTRLAGLSVSPVISPGASEQARPRIEEIE